MNKRRVDGWKGLGDCDRCTHQRICRRECDAHEALVSKQVKKALLMEADRKNNPGRLEGETP